MSSIRSATGWILLLGIERGVAFGEESPVLRKSVGFQQLIDLGDDFNQLLGKTGNPLTTTSPPSFAPVQAPTTL
jgi:hypothetical protein